MIVAQNVSKNYGSHQALNKVSFEIKSGEIVGFLGKNGAGKTTLMRILTAFLPASAGTVTIDGKDVAKSSLEVRKVIGYLPETPPLYPNMTVQDYLRFAAEIKGIAAKQRRHQLHRVLDECQLESVKGRVISTLSKGYKQRVGIAQAIIHQPKLLILDEPTSGLDPVQNQQVRELINNQQQQRTVLLSTHTLSEIEQIAHRVLIIKTGNIIVDDSLDALMTQSLSPNGKRQSLEKIFIDLHRQPLGAER
jgi:ABC-2 type transport system ATP-binding protein